MAFRWEENIGKKQKVPPRLFPTNAQLAIELVTSNGMVNRSANPICVCNPFMGAPLRRETGELLSSMRPGDERCRYSRHYGNRPRPHARIESAPGYL